jgi:hypothetical protein
MKQLLPTVAKIICPLIFRPDAPGSRADLMSDYLARRATYVGTEPTGERGVINSSGGKEARLAQEQLSAVSKFIGCKGCGGSGRVE